MAVVGVDHRLHGVAHVVDARPEVGGSGQPADGIGLQRLRVRILGGSRVEVDHPQDLAVLDHWIRVVVEMEEGGNALDDVAHISLDEHPAVGADLARDEEVEVAVAERKRNPLPDAVEGDSGLARVFVVGGSLLVRQWEVHFLWLVACADDHRPALLIGLPEIDPGLVELEALNCGLRRHIFQQEVRLPVLGHLVGDVDHCPEAMGVEEALVQPVFTGQIHFLELAHRQHDLGRYPIVEVSIRVDHRQRVVVPKLLKALIGARQHGRIPDAQIVDRELVGLDVRHFEIVSRREAPYLDFVQSPRLAGELDAVLDIWALPWPEAGDSPGCAG